MSIKALQDYVYTSKYARYRPDLKRRETWEEAVDRVKNMHFQKFPDKNVHDDIEWAYEQVKLKKVLGSQRALQYGGTPILKTNARQYNCTFSYCDRTRFFQEAFWLLLCGCGTGFSVQKHHIAKLPEFYPYGRKDKKTFVIPDTIEGWADSLGVLLATYLPHEEFAHWEGCEVDFDYSLIRPKGSPLSSGAGKAPGPQPLRDSLELIRILLNRCLDQGQRSLRPINAYDVVMFASEAVLSGGVRRSASLSLFSPDDDEMATAKTGNWFAENPQRGRSNNSALLVRNQVSREQFGNLFRCTKEHGEPGYIWSDSSEQGYNPCVEASLYPVEEGTGLVSWQFCNLCEINGKECDTEGNFALAARAGAIIGTLQSAYTDFDYLGPIAKKIAERENLLGVSITGMMDNPDILFDPYLQRKMAQMIVETNIWMAAKLGINPSARTTCIKPAGTTSCILGTGSGVHPHHARRYFRRVQANDIEAPLLHFTKYNPMAVEKSVWGATGTDRVITFCVEIPEQSRSKHDMTAIQLLECVKLTQQNWVEYGTNYERLTQPFLRHSVSNTINVRPHEWDEVEDFIYDNRQFFAGVSLLPQSGDLDYPQAPMVTIASPIEVVSKYGEGSLLASGLIVGALEAFNGNLWKACDAVLGYGDSIEDNEAQMDWVRRAKQFALRYFKNNLLNMCWCLKEVNNWKLWCDLKREYKHVDYSEMIEETDETKLMETVACSGGACEII